MEAYLEYFFSRDRSDSMHCMYVRFHHWDENPRNVTNYMGRFIPFDRCWNIKLNKKCDKIQRVMHTCTLLCSHPCTLIKKLVVLYLINQVISKSKEEKWPSTRTYTYKKKMAESLDFIIVSKFQMIFPVSMESLVIVSWNFHKLENIRTHTMCAFSSVASTATKNIFTKAIFSGVTVIACARTVFSFFAPQFLYL